MLLLFSDFTIQYEVGLFFFFFIFKMSLLNNLKSRDVGVTTRKKTIPITIGDTIFPKNRPNLYHTLLSGFNNLELLNPKIKKIKEIIIDQYLN
mgnify:CR=1 FL=1